MNQMLREVLVPAGGKGGGSKDFAQGTVPEAANIDELLAKARELLGRQGGGSENTEKPTVRTPLTVATKPGFVESIDGWGVTGYIARGRAGRAFRGQ